MKKQCFKCKRVKTLNQFYINSRMADGHLNKCKSCAKKDSRKRYVEHFDAVQAYERERFKNPERKKKTLEYQRRQRLKYPGKHKARAKVLRAIRSGRIVRLPCEICGNVKSEAHHEDYRSYLKVRWLCRKHHREVDNVSKR